MVRAVDLERQEIECRPHRWSVLCGGSGPTVLCLHGAGSSADSFRTMAERLAGRYRVVAPDLPGHGQTRLGTSTRSGLQHMAEDVARLVEESFGQPDFIVGHSAGGAIAIALNRHLSPRGQVLINPALHPFSGPSGWLFPAIAKALSGAPFASRIIARSLGDTERMRALLSETGSAITPAMIDRYRSLASDSRHIQGTLRMMAAWDLTGLAETVRQLETPTLMLLGKRDGTVDPDLSRVIALSCPSIRVQDFDAGHLLHEEKGDAVTKTILRFLDEIAGLDPYSEPSSARKNASRPASI